MRLITFIINGVPIVFPANFVISEGSSTNIDYIQSNSSVIGKVEIGEESLKTSLASSKIDITLQISTGGGYLNTYNLFKGAMEALAYWTGNPNYPSVGKFFIYIGVNEFCEFATLSDQSFHARPLSNSLFEVSFSFQRKEIGANSDLTSGSSTGLGESSIPELQGGAITPPPAPDVFRKTRQEEAIYDIYRVYEPEEERERFSILAGESQLLVERGEWIFFEGKYFFPKEEWSAFENYAFKREGNTFLWGIS